MLKYEKVDLTWVQGAEFHLGIEYQLEDETPINLTGYTTRFRVKSSYGTTDILVDITEVANTQGVITITHASGLLDLKVEEAVTEVCANSMVYDWFLYEPDGDAISLIGGTISVRKSVM